MWEESWNSELVLSLSEVTVGPVLGAGCCARDVPSGQDGLRGAGCMSRKRWGSAVLCVSLLWYCLRLLGIEPHAPVPCACPAGTVRTAGLSPAARCDVVGHLWWAMGILVIRGLASLGWLVLDVL